MIVPQYGSSEITVFVWGKNMILKFVVNTKYKSMKLTLQLVVVVLIAPTKLPRPHFLDRPLIWPGYFSEHIPAAFLDYILRVCQSLRDSFFHLGKLHWFLYLLISYYYDPGMFIFCWSSNFVEKVVLNESMAAKMESFVSYCL